MDNDNTKRKFFKNMDNSQAATVLIIAVIFIALFAAYAGITHSIQIRSIGRMNESVNTVIAEIQTKFARDSNILNSAADIISADSTIDNESMADVINYISPLLETMNVYILFPDDTVLNSAGEISAATYSDDILFRNEAPLGEHVSDKVYSAGNNTPILRHFVPITHNGETIALIYGVTRLEELPERLNTDNIYNGAGSTYIIDTKSGDFIMDTYHNELGNMSDFEGRASKGGKAWTDVRKDILSQGTGFASFRSQSTGEWEYLIYAPMNINQWVVAVSVPEKEALASVYAVRRIGIATGMVIAVFVILYYFWIRRNAKMRMEQAVGQAVLKEKLRKAEAADRAKSVFLSNMSHDIRTPMNAIIGFTALAQTNIDNKEKLQDYHKKILSSCNHLLSLINDILDMSRIESGKLNIEEKECSISDIFRDMRNIIQNQMHSKQLNFVMDTLDISDENIFCDKLHLNQVLLNLLSNAIKFTPAGGTVALVIEQKQSAPKGCGAYEIRVKDTGIGMSKEFAEHIFEPFERERTSTVSGIQGTGLGMAITKNIVDAMGGKIEVRTEKNKGTEFILDFNFRLQQEHKNAEHIHELEGLKALVVDDSYSTCDSITKMLRQIGMCPEWTLHGHEAILRAKQAHELGAPFSAYVIDWLLPDLSGVEVVRQIRAIVGDEVPIIIVTAYDRSVFEEEALAAGATAFCDKPVFLSELQNILLDAITDKKDTEKQAAAPKPDEKRFDGVRILLVEDNEINCEIAEEVLKEKGFTVESAHDGTEALDMVKKSKPGYYALILMDIQMPVMNGYEATKAIRALDDKALSDIPIIAMTANAFEEDKKQALECGMNAHVAKPFDAEKLTEVIAQFIN